MTSIDVEGLRDKVKAMYRDVADESLPMTDPEGNEFCVRLGGQPD
jgi:hypothetical protein